MQGVEKCYGNLFQLVDAQHGEGSKDGAKAHQKIEVQNTLNNWVGLAYKLIT